MGVASKAGASGFDNLELLRERDDVMTTEDELLRRLTNHEDNLVERKPDGANGGALRRTLVAFANTVRDGEEAVLFIGVADRDGAVLGVENTDAMQKYVNRAAMDCFPPIRVDQRALEKDGKQFVAVIVRRSEHRPHFAGQAYIRKGSESVAASQEAVNELVDRRHSKARLLLDWKGKVVTRTFPDGRVREAIIVDCNAHFVRINGLNSGEVVNRPLESVSLAWDDRLDRLWVYT